MSAREVALEVLYAVDTRGAYPALALAKHRQRAQLSGRDQAFVTELVYGTLRWRGLLDWLIGECATRPLAKMPAWIRNILRLTVYQIRFSGGVPGSAACNEAVKLARRKGHPGTVRLVNALCRAVLRRAEDEWPWPEVDQDPVHALSVLCSHPPWLVRRWVDRWGVAEARALCTANNQPAPLTVRVNSLRTDPVRLARRLQESGVQVVPGRWAPQALHLQGRLDLENNPAFRAGEFQVQDEAAQLVTHMLDPQPGERIVDLCAAPGGKTTHIAQLMGDHGTVLAMDVHPEKLRLVADACGRLGIRSVHTMTGDARRPPQHWLQTMDRVLLDAPCSGLGLVRRRPDLRWRKQPGDIRQAAELQREILGQAAALLRPGGVLVYSVCTTESEETDGVVNHFLADRRDFSVCPPKDVIPMPVPGDADIAAKPAPDGGGGTLLLPHRHGTDGFFMVRMQRSV